MENHSHIIIIIIIIFIINISFMQGTYTHIPETNYVPREHGVAAILLSPLMVLILLLAVLNLLYFYISTFRSMCAVPNMALFCSSLTSWFPGMLLTYFLHVFEIVPVAPIITGITFVFTFHMRSISIVRSLYFRIFQAAFLITFLSPEIATSINIYLLLLLLNKVCQKSGSLCRVDIYHKQTQKQKMQMQSSCFPPEQSHVYISQVSLRIIYVGFQIKSKNCILLRFHICFRCKRHFIRSLFISYLRVRGRAYKQRLGQSWDAGDSGYCAYITKLHKLTDCW